MAGKLDQNARVLRVSWKHMFGCLALALAGHIAIPLAQAAAQEVRIIDRFAGGSNGDGGPASGATLDPVGLDTDQFGNLYIADTPNNQVRKVDAVTGFITSVAGTGAAGYSGDGGLATEADLSGPIDVEVDVDGNLFISDRGNHRVRRVDASTGIIATIAGNGNGGFSGDNGPATSARLNNPGGIGIDPGADPNKSSDDSIYITDTSNNRIREVLAGGGITTVAGNGVFGYSGDNGPATNARLALPADVAVGPYNGPQTKRDLYIADFANQRLRVVRGESGKIFTAAGSGQFGFCVGALPPQETCFRNPLAIEYDPVDDAIFLADAANHRVMRIPLDGGLVTTVAGTGINGYNGDGILAVEAWLEGPSGIAVDPSFGVFVADQFNYRIRRIERGANPLISTVAGNGNQPFAGDGGPALSAKFNNPQGIAVDDLGNFYIADSQNHRVRRISASGTVSTIAGTGDLGFSGDGGAATSAELASPTDIAIGNDGSLYIADKDNNRIRKVSASGVITTIASTQQPSSIAIYENASATLRVLYALESAQHTVWAVNLNTSAVTRYAGTGTFGYSGDGGPASAAKLAVPLGIATDGNNNLYIADTANQRVRKVSPNGIISTFAGNGSFGFDGDGGLAISAKLAGPSGVAVGPMGTLLILDFGNRRVRAVDTQGIIQTAAGTGYQTGRIDGEGGNPLDDLGDQGPATAASFSTLAALTFDSTGHGYICDSEAATIRWIEDLSSLYAGGPPQSAVSGMVRYATSLSPVPGVAIQAFGPTNESDNTNGSGTYDLGSMESAPWLLEPVKQGGVGSGIISPLDASHVLQEVVGLRTFTSAQQLACDVTGDGEISALDASRILQRSLGGSTPFPAAANCGSDWLFEPNAASAPNQTQIQPLLENGTTCRRGAIQFNPLTGQPDGQDFTAIVVGDCTTNWGGSGGAATSTLARARAATTGASATIGPERSSRRRVRVPISIGGTSGFNALEIHLGFDPSAVRPLRVRTRSDARGAMIGWQENEPGEMTIVLASAKTIPAPARNAIIIDFEVVGELRRSAVRSARVAVDDDDARIRVTRGRRRR